MTTDHQDILETALGDIPEPRNAPEGTWTMQIVSGKWKTVKANDDGTTPLYKALFALRAVEAGDDVNPDELEESGSVEGLQPVYHEIPIFSKPDLWNIVRFAKWIGVEEDMYGPMKPQDLVPALTGYTLKAHLRVTRNEGYDDKMEASAFAAA